MIHGLGVLHFKIKEVHYNLNQQVKYRNLKLKILMESLKKKML